MQCQSFLPEGSRRFNGETKGWWGEGMRGEATILWIWAAIFTVLPASFDWIKEHSFFLYHIDWHASISIYTKCNTIPYIVWISPIYHMLHVLHFNRCIVQEVFFTCAILCNAIMTWKQPNAWQIIPWVQAPRSACSTAAFRAQSPRIWIEFDMSPHLLFGFLFPTPRKAAACLSKLPAPADQSLGSCALAKNPLPQPSPSPLHSWSLSPC